MTTPTIPLNQFQIHFTGIFLCLSAFKIIQRYAFCVELWFLRHQKVTKLPTFRNCSPPSPLSQFQDNVIEMFLMWPSTKMFKPYWLVKKQVSKAESEKGQNYILYNSILIKGLSNFKIILAEKWFYIICLVKKDSR